jgi:uncharacterized protein with PQ loop repeat
MEIFRNFFIDGFVPGNYTYGFVHIFSIVLVLILIPTLIFLFKGKDSDYVYSKLRWIAIVTLAIYFLRRGIDVYKGKDVIEAFWPFYLCNVNTIFLSLFIALKIKKGQEFFIITGMLGAILMFVVPVGVFNDKYITIQILDSVLSHYEIVLLPIVLLFSGAYKLDIKKSWQVFLGLFILLFNVEVLQPILINRTEDFLFVRGTLPFTIDGVPQVFIMLFSIGVYIYLIYGIDYLIRRNKKEKSN